MPTPEEQQRQKEQKKGWDSMTLGFVATTASSKLERKVAVDVPTHSLNAGFCGEAVLCSLAWFAYSAVQNKGLVVGLIRLGESVLDGRACFDCRFVDSLLLGVAFWSRSCVHAAGVGGGSCVWLTAFRLCAVVGGGLGFWLRCCFIGSGWVAVATVCVISRDPPCDSIVGDFVPGFVSLYVLSVGFFGQYFEAGAFCNVT